MLGLNSLTLGNNDFPGVTYRRAPPEGRGFQFCGIEVHLDLPGTPSCLALPGSASVEAAVNWIVEHEEDPDIDTMPMVKPRCTTRSRAPGTANP